MYGIHDFKFGSFELMKYFKEMCVFCLHKLSNRLDSQVSLFFPSCLSSFTYQHLKLSAALSDGKIMCFM